MSVSDVERGPRRPPGLLLLTVIVIIVGSAGLSVRQAHADVAYDANAAAFAMNVEISNPSFPFGLVVGSEAPIAQAHQSSLQQSDALAAFPYPGETIATAPGAVATVMGIPLPAYPLFVTTSFGQEPKDAEFPAISLHAESGDSVTAAKAVSGSGSSGATAASRIETNKAGEVTATALATGDFATLGGLLRVSGMRNGAHADRDAQGALTRSSTLSFARLTVPGLSLTFPATTPVLGGQTLPAPDLGFEDGSFTLTLPAGGTQKYVVPAQPVLDAFKAVGISVTYQPAIKTDNGIIGEGLTFKTVLASPPAGLNGATPVSVSFGRAKAEVSYASFDTGEIPPGPNVPQLPVDAGANAPSDGTTGPALDPGLDPGATSTTDAGHSPELADGAQSGSGLASGVALRKADVENLGWIYLLLVAVALTSFGTTTLLRFLGVRFAWRS